MKFKVGDKVKVVDGIFKGNTGIINMVDEEDNSLSYLVVCFFRYRGRVKEEALELITDDIEEKEKSSMKTFTYGFTNITTLSNLKYGDCFQILEGDYKGQYGMVCAFPDKCDDDYVRIVIFSESETFPIIKYVGFAEQVQVKRVVGEVSFKEGNNYHV